MENFTYIIFMIIIIIISGALRSFFNKAAKQRYNKSNNVENEAQTNNEDEEDTGKNEKSIIEEIFKDYSLKKENEVYNKTSYLKEKDVSPIDNEIIKVEDIEQNKKIESEIKQTITSFDKMYKNNTIKKEPSLARIKKLSYLKQAIILSEIMGIPKGLDI